MHTISWHGFMQPQHCRLAGAWDVGFDWRWSDVLDILIGEMNTCQSILSRQVKQCLETFKAWCNADWNPNEAWGLHSAASQEIFMFVLALNYFVATVKKKLYRSLLESGAFMQYLTPLPQLSLKGFQTRDNPRVVKILCKKHSCNWHHGKDSRVVGWSQDWSEFCDVVLGPQQRSCEDCNMWSYGVWTLMCYGVCSGLSGTVLGVNRVKFGADFCQRAGHHQIQAPISVHEWIGP